MLRKRIGAAVIATLTGFGLAIGGAVPAQAAVTNPTVYGPVAGGLGIWRPIATLLNQIVPGAYPAGMNDDTMTAHAAAHITTTANSDGSKTITVGDCPISDFNVRYAVGELEDVTWDISLGANWTLKDPSASLTLTPTEIRSLFTGVVVNVTVQFPAFGGIFGVGAYPAFQSVYALELGVGATQVSTTASNPAANVVSVAAVVALSTTAGTLLDTIVGLVDIDIPLSTITDFLNQAVSSLVVPSLNLGSFSYALDFNGQLVDGESYTIDPQNIIADSWLNYLNQSASVNDLYLSNITLEGILGTAAYNAVKAGYEAVFGAGSWNTNYDSLSGMIALALGGVLQTGVFDSLLQTFITGALADAQTAIEGALSAAGVAGAVTIDTAWQAQVSSNLMTLLKQKLDPNAAGSWLRIVLDNVGGTFWFTSAVTGTVGTVIPTGILETQGTTPTTIVDDFTGMPGDTWQAASYPGASITAVIGDTNVATYDPATGVITAVGPGSTTITLSATAACPLYPGQTVTWVLAEYTVTVVTQATALPVTGAFGGGSSAPVLAGLFGLGLVGAGAYVLRRRSVALTGHMA